MPKYQVTLQTVASAYMTVEAEDLEEAIVAAMEDAPFICAQCSGFGQSWSLELGEWDIDDSLDSEAVLLVEEAP